MHNDGADQHSRRSVPREGVPVAEFACRAAPHADGLEPVVRIGEDDDAVRMIRNPVTFSASLARYDLPPPAIGQDNETMRAWLGRPAAASRPAPEPAGMHGTPEVDAGAVGRSGPRPY